MTLTDALDHEWLALPASQHSEGPLYQLGGDSMYGIADFDNVSEGSISRRASSECSRPMTASGTNLMSGIDLTDLRAGSVESDDSYSQKVEDFHLHSSPRTKARSAKSVPHPLSLSTANPPSPPITDDRMDVGASAVAPHGDGTGSENGNGNGNGVVKRPHGNGLQIESGAETPNTATKRKALELDIFNSGSLSPPPQEDIELSSPITSIKPSTPQSAEASPLIDARATRRTTRSTVKPNTGTPARGRKSMRLT